MCIRTNNEAVNHKVIVQLSTNMAFRPCEEHTTLSLTVVKLIATACEQYAWKWNVVSSDDEIRDWFHSPMGSSLLLWEQVCRNFLSDYGFRVSGNRARVPIAYSQRKRRIATRTTCTTVACSSPPMYIVQSFTRYDLNSIVKSLHIRTV